MIKYIENKLKYEGYYKLRESAGWKNFSKEQTISAINKSIYSVVAQCEDEVVGMGRLVGDDLYYTIVDVVIKPEYQSQGIGKEIVNRLIDYVKEVTPIEGKASIMLIAAPGKEPFYEKLGLKELPNEGSGAGMRMLVIK